MNDDCTKVDLEARLKEFRSGIDEVDRTLLELLAQRIGHAVSIGEIKAKLGRDIYDGDREKNVMVALQSYGRELGIGNELIERVYEPIFEYMRQIQRSKK